MSLPPTPWTAERIASGCIAVCLLLGVILRWPAMDTGFRGDDYVQMAALGGEFAAPRASWDLFRFDGATAADARALIEQGYHPWWTSPDLRLAMWRPLSSLLLAADHALLGAAPFLHHLHSMLWWLALAGAAAWLFRRIMPVRAAIFATLLFVLEEAHTIPLAWLANRSTLVASALAVVALGLHIRLVRDAGGASRTAQLATVGTTILALSAGEYALSVLVYLWTYELTATDRSLQRRLRSAAPTFACAVVYVAVRGFGGHGVASSGYYIDLLSDPLGFGAIAVQRLPALYGDALLGIPARMWTHGAPLRNELLSLVGTDVFRQLPRWVAVQWTAGALGVIGAGFCVRFLLSRTDDGAQRHMLRTLALGALLSALPVAGSLPEDRLLIGTALGVCAIVGMLVSELLGDGRRRIGVGAMATIGLLAAIHVGLAATRSRTGASQFADRALDLRTWALDARLPTGDAAALTDVYLIAAADFTTAANLPWLRAAHGVARTRSYRRLSGALHAHDLHRTGESTLELTVMSRHLRGAFMGSLYRGKDEPIPKGSRFAMRGMRVEILETLDGNPYRMRFEFDRSLDDPRLLLLQAGRRGVVRLTPPPIGERMLVIRPQTAP